MDLLIKNMEMPKCCALCNFRHFAGRVDDLVIMYCTMTGHEMTTDKERAKTCPLIEVPTPHGDLIDRDILISKLTPSEQEEAELKSSDFMAYLLTKDLMQIVINEIKSLPAVIDE